MFLIRWGKEANGEDGKGKACGLYELPIEAMQIILEYKPECIVEAFNNIPRTNEMPKWLEKEQDGTYIQRQWWCTGMQQLQMYQTDEPYNEAMGTNYRRQTD